MMSLLNGRDRSRRAAKFCSAIVIAISLLWCLPHPAAAQGEWSPPVDVSTPRFDGERQPNWNPRILSDRSGGVHALWALQTPGSSATGGDFILYARWQEGVWSAPNEIIAGPDGRGVSPFDAVIDEFGVMHIIFYGRDPGRDAFLYVTSAPVAEAGDSRAWSEPQSLVYYAGEAIFGAAGDLLVSGDELHMVAVEEGIFYDDLVHWRSEDGGHTWIEGKTFKAAVIDGARFWSPRLAMDELGNLHVAWVTEAAPGEGYDGAHALYHAVMPPGGSWSEPFQLALHESRDVFFNDVNIAVDGSGALHAIWNTSGLETYRWHRVSLDYGLTWSEMQPIYAGSGRTLWPAVAIDGDGWLHVVSSGNALNSGSNLIHAMWTGGEWSPLESLNAIHDVNGESPSTAVRLGNELHLLWRNDKRAAISHMVRTLDVAAIEPADYRTPEYLNSPSSDQSNRDHRGSTPADQSRTVDNVASKRLEGQPDLDASDASRSNFGLMLSLMPVLILIAAIAYMQTRGR